MRIVELRRGSGKLERIILPFPKHLLSPHQLPRHTSVVARLRLLSVPEAEFRPETLFVMVVVTTGDFTFGRGSLEGVAVSHWDDFVRLLQVLKEDAKATEDEHSCGDDVTRGSFLGLQRVVSKLDAIVLTVLTVGRAQLLHLLTIANC